MRGMVRGLPTPHPVARELPAVYREDALLEAFTRILDEMLAPVLATLDGLDAYLDPRLAPADFLELLAFWVALPLEPGWPLDRRQSLVGGATELFRRRGTLAGLAELVARHIGVEPEIEDSGGVAWSATPGGHPPGNPEPSLVVRVRVPDPAAVDRSRLDALVAAAKPAHVPHRVEVVRAREPRP